jgi:hypothetical protein
MNKRLSVISAAIVLILLLAVPALAGISGTGTSGVQIQNLDTTNPALIVVEMYNQNGAAPVEITASGGDTINPGAAANYYMPILGLDDGSYALSASGDKPIAAIARTEWAATGGAALYGSTTPATDVTVPLVLGNFAGQTSQFTVQNTDSNSQITDVTITLYGRGSGTPVTTLTSQVIGAGTSRTYTVNSATFGALPNTGLDFGATGFLGSVKITSATNLVVQSFIDIAGTRGVTAFSGVDSTSADTTLFCPLLRANFYGDTGIQLVNPGGTAATVDITFYSDQYSPNSGTFTQSSIVVPANSSFLAFQGLGGNSRTDAGIPGGTQTTANMNTKNGWFGVGKIESTVPIIAVVNDALYGSNWALEAQGTYNCSTTADAGMDFALPLLRKDHVASLKLTTGVQIQNTTGSSVDVTLQLFDWNGNAQAVTNPAMLTGTIPAWGALNLYQGNLNGLPTVPANLGGSGWYGSGVLTATGPVAVLVNDAGFGSTAVDSANYGGLLIP